MNQTKMKNRQFLGMTRETFFKKYGIIFILLLMVGIMLVVSPTFRTYNNVLSIMQSVAVNGCLALGMVFVITAGGIDLSIGSQLALTSVVIGCAFAANAPIPVAIIASIAMCTAFGFINGLLVSRLKLFPFVVTLATQLVIRGAAYIISDGKASSITNKSFRTIGMGKVGDVIPVCIFIFLGLAVIAFILLHCTKFGRFVYAVGGNINAAIASGIKVKWVQTFTYAWMGVCAGVAGIILTSRINAAQPNIGSGYETDAIAACVIGGTSFAGGISTIPGTIIGIIIIGVIYNGMNLLQVNSYYQMALKGILIILSVVLDNYLNKRRG